ncbi:MAG: molybdopterin-dependent oxidoreductase, partial [Nitrospirales bacterium]
ALTGLIKVITERDRTGPEVLRLDGAVIQPITLDHQALRALPQEHQVSDVGQLMPGIRGRGICVKGLLELPALAVEADHVTFHARDGQFAASVRLKEAAEFGVLVYELDGAPLPPSKGGPFRLVTPGLGDLCANVKDVGRLEITVGAGRDTRPSRKGTSTHE